MENLTYETLPNILLIMTVAGAVVVGYIALISKDL